MNQRISFVWNPGECSRPEVPITIESTPEDKKLQRNLAALQRSVGKRVVMFLENNNGAPLSPENSLSEHDIKELERFFQEYEWSEIFFNASQWSTILDKVGFQKLKGDFLMQEYVRFLNLFDSFPSLYAIKTLERIAQEYEQVTGIEPISKEDINQRYIIVYMSYLEWQIKAMENWGNLDYKKEQVTKYRTELQNLWVSEDTIPNIPKI